MGFSSSADLGPALLQHLKANLSTANELAPMTVGWSKFTVTGQMTGPLQWRQSMANKDRKCRGRHVAEASALLWGCVALVSGVGVWLWLWVILVPFWAFPDADGGVVREPLIPGLFLTFLAGGVAAAALSLFVFIHSRRTHPQGGPRQLWGAAIIGPVAASIPGTVIFLAAGGWAPVLVGTLCVLSSLSFLWSSGSPISIGVL